VRLTVVDLTEDFNERCKKYGINFIRHDLGKFPFPFSKNYFDLIIFGEILEHLLADHGLILKELEGILKRGGGLFFRLLTEPP